MTLETLGHGHPPSFCFFFEGAKIDFWSAVSDLNLKGSAGGFRLLGARNPQTDSPTRCIIRSKAGKKINRSSRVITIEGVGCLSYFF